jgi:hypothetical protein
LKFPNGRKKILSFSLLSKNTKDFLRNKPRLWGEVVERGERLGSWGEGRVCGERGGS